MKKLSLFVSVFALCASSSFAAINCGTLPTCAELGYTDKISQCPAELSARGLAGNGNLEWQYQYIKCPFSNPTTWADTEVKCLHSAAVGQIGYFTRKPGRGWILCNGQSVPKKQYPQLAAFLGEQFGGNNTTFNVPDYRGFFLRVRASSVIPATDKDRNGVRSDFFNYGKHLNTKVDTPQAEGLPNIMGGMKYIAHGAYKNAEYDEGAIYGERLTWSGAEGNASGGGPTEYIRFNASRYNSIYGSSTGVTPPNMAVDAYIYAGLTVD